MQNWCRPRYCLWGGNLKSVILIKQKHNMQMIAEKHGINITNVRTRISIDPWRFKLQK